MDLAIGVYYLIKQSSNDMRLPEGKDEKAESEYKVIYIIEEQIY